MRSRRTMIWAGMGLMLLVTAGLLVVRFGSPSQTAITSANQTEPQPATVAMPVTERPSGLSMRKAPEAPPVSTSATSAKAASIPVVEASTLQAPVAPTNAAQVYRQAFALLETLTDEERNALKNWKGTVPATVTAALMRKLKPVLELAREAANVTNCDWEVANAGYETPLPHLKQARTLADGLLWDATHGDGGAVDADIWAALALGDSVSEYLIGHLVNTAIQNGVVDFLSDHAERVSVDTLRQIADSFTDGRYKMSLYRAILTEAQMADRAAERFSGMTLEQARTAIGQLSGDSELVLSSLPQLVAAGREVARLERDYAEAMFSDDSALKSAWLDRMRTAENANPIIDWFLPALDAVEDRSQAMIVRFAMTAVGVALLQGQTDALQTHRDPWTGKPFGYQTTSNGFELRSGLEQNGQPIRITFRIP